MKKNIIKNMKNIYIVDRISVKIKNQNEKSQKLKVKE